MEQIVLKVQFKYMKIIEKIEIKYFRSFADKKVEISDLKDVNVFSGGNDSGKSNVLRALNLFFNEEVSHGVKFNLEKDFSKITEKNFESTFKKTKRKRKSDKFVSIKIHFLNPDKSRNLPEKFWVSKKYTNTNYLFGEKEYKKEIKNKANQVSHFLNSINFQYVPAIKDKDFYNFLIDEYQKSLNPETRKLIQGLDEKIKDESRLLFEEFQKITPEIKRANFQIPKFKIDFAKTLKVQTESEIDLESRGDGIQAKFLPPLLDEISKDRRNVIWGFEEPENSLEYKNSRDLADSFLYKYSDKKQIFITTHSKEFLRLRDVNKVAIYRIFKDKYDNSSKIILHRDFETDDDRKKYIDKQLVLFSENISKNDKQTVLNQIFDDLGMIDESKIIYDLEKELKAKPSEIKLKIREITQQSEKVTQKNNELNEIIKNNNKPLLFVEDSYDQIYKIAWLKLSDKECLENCFEDVFNKECKFSIFKAEGATCLAGFLRQKNIDYYKDKKVIGLFDFDEKGREQFNCMRNEDYWKVEPAGEITTGIYKKRNDHECFYSLLIPIPEKLNNLANLSFPSFIEIENLLPSSFLLKNSFALELKTTGNTDYIEIKKDIKSKIWKRLFDLSKNDFENFRPLFNKINELFNIKND